MEVYKVHSLSKWENLTVDELLHPNLLFYSRLYMDVIFGLSILVYIFTIYVIVTKSTPAMGIFKHFLLLHLSFCLWIHFNLFLTNAVIIFPLPLVAFNSHLPLKSEWLFYMIAFAVLPGAFVMSTFVLALGSRIISMYNLFGAIIMQRRFKQILVFWIFITIFGWLSVYVPFVFVVKDPTIVKKIFVTNVPALNTVYKYLPAANGIVINSTSLSVPGQIGIIAGGLWVIILKITVIIFNFIFRYRLNQLKSQITKETYTFQKMLHKCLMTQLLNAFLFGVIPVISGGLVFFIFQFKCLFFLGYIIIPIIQLHFIFNALSTLNCIKSYRMFVKKFFRRNQIDNF